jgi:peptide/nickel transport system substrate-binding protein
MKKFLPLAAILLCSAAHAAPFIFPKNWTTSSPEANSLGGTYRIGTTVGATDDFITHNPFVATTNLTTESFITSRGLFTNDPLTDEVTPYMAQSYTVSANKLVWTLKLRSGMKWSDGQPIVGQDWVTTAQIHASSEIITNRRDSFFIDGKPIVVTSPNDETVIYSFPKTVATAVDVMSLPVWPAHVFAPVLSTQGIAGLKTMWGLSENPKNIVSTGPFRVQSYQAGKALTLERNPFFGEWNVNASGQPLPYLSTVTRQIYKDRVTMTADYLRGELDQISTSSPTEVAQIQTAINQNGLRAVLRLNIAPQTSRLLLSFNWNIAADPFKQELFRNVNFRQAMSFMLNRQAIVTEAFSGLAKPLYGSLTDALGDWVSPDIQTFRYDLDAARKSLAKIGFNKKNSDGLLVNRDGKTISFNVMNQANTPLLKPALAVMTRDAQALGIRMNFVETPQAQLVASVTSVGKNRAWEAVLILRDPGLVSSNFPMDARNFSCGGRTHFFNRSGSCIDPLETQASVLYERGLQTTSVATRKQIAYKMQEVDSQLQGIIYIVSPSVQYSWLERVQGENSNISVAGVRSLEVTWLR